MTLFQGNGLACRRGEIPVFEGLDFVADPGDALWLAGPNGSGKSSLLRLMAGLLEPVDGSIAWNGAPIADDREAHRTRLRYLGHLDAVKPHLSVAENLRFWAQYWGAPRDAVPGALERLGLARLGDAAGRRLSAGQRRRLALARLLLAPAKLWLLDEPTAALDSDGIRLFLILVAECRAQGGIVVFSSHDVLALPDLHRLTLAGDLTLAEEGA
jgi:heme exporter protein A